MSPSAAHRPARQTQTQRSQATREHLIATAIEVVRDRSFQGATIFEVAKAAGMTPGALQHHFASKAELMLQVVGEILRASDGTGVPWPDAGLPLEERAHRYVEALWRRVYEPPRFLAAWSVYFGSSSDPVSREALAAQRRLLSQSLCERFVMVFPETQGQKDIDAFVDLVLSCLRGMGVVRLFGPDDQGGDAQRRILVDIIISRCKAAPSPSGRPARKKSS